MFPKHVCCTVMQAISPQQHGFLKGKSTTTNLVEFTGNMLQSMDGGYQINVIYTDFQKAFDRVDRSILIMTNE